MFFIFCQANINASQGVHFSPIVLLKRMRAFEIVLSLLSAFGLPTSATSYSDFYSVESRMLVVTQS